MKTRKHHYKVMVSRSFLNIFKKQLEDKIKEMPKNIPFVLQKYTNQSVTSNPPQLSNQFLDYRIANYLQHKKYKVEKTYVIQGKTVNITLYFFKKMAKQSIELLLKKIYLLLLLFFNEASVDININIYFTHFKKHMPSTSEFTSYHVNSGVCSFGGPVKEITIYREEEWFKVLIHEMFHALNFDDKFSEYVHPDIVDKFNIQNLKLFGETYVELWATIYNVMITIFLSKQNFFKKVTTYLQKEFMHCIDQNKKILAKNNTTYEVEITKPKFIHLEKQNLLYYYVFKMILFYKLNNFLEICNSDNHILQLNKDKTTKLLDLIVKTYKHPMLVRLVKHKRLRKTRNLKMTITR
jgi:hypothetical protein